ncbi:hypothetical protein [Bradyrhizobium sp. CCBAU 51753]|uniref:hypothetical protein n=1 Tax=Bradyrhizobium sp. CCBAU 51753 TaxID=1325100 RepID=UPI001FEDD34D|nr:hypothetical protein [Bradyrhizobium sp. CCBAU 51753]
MNDLEIRRADCDRVNPDQNLGSRWDRRRLLAQEKLIGIAKHPGLHQIGNGKVGRCFDAGGLIHGRSLF